MACTYDFKLSLGGDKPFEVLRIFFNTAWNDVDPSYVVASLEDSDKEDFFFWLDRSTGYRGHSIDSKRLSPQMLWTALHDPSNNSPYTVTVEGDVPSGPVDDDDILESADSGNHLNTGGDVPHNVSENMSRGIAAMEKVSKTGEPVDKAMFRDGLGWIAFRYGCFGDAPETDFEALKALWETLTPDQRRTYPFKNGEGIAHMIAKREWESKHIHSLLGQSATDFLADAVRTIAFGIAHNKTRDTVEYVYPTPMRTVYLKRDITMPGDIDGNEYWILTDYVIQNTEYKLVDPETQQVVMESAHTTTGEQMDNQPILEQAAPNTDFEKELNACTSFAEIKALFEQWFDIDGGSDPDDYKNPKSQYGLKVRGKKAREALNAKAKEIIDRVKSPEELTETDREILLQYSGRGGTSNNSQSEYYTPTHVAEGIWDAMKANGFENGNVLEPSCGAGVFLGTKPSGVVMTANDIDETSSGVARLLNPSDKVSTSPFEQIVMDTPDDTFDSCVGNVPFGGARGASMHLDPAYKTEKRMERYFLLRILDKIRPGGLACLVCPTQIVGSKDEASQRFRRALSKKAEFLGAHKLPSKTFAAQGTDTVTDVVVFRKHSKEFLERLRLDEYPTETLVQANVYWDEFISGNYWKGEGKKFIMGKYTPKVDGDRWSRETVDGDIDNATMKANLARKFESRINWDLLNETEPVTRNYSEGDSRYINGEPYQYTNGEWQKVVINSSTGNAVLDRAKYGVDSVEELRGVLADNQTALGLTLSQAFAAFKAYPEFMTKQQQDAVEFAMSQNREEVREQVYRGSLLGSMIAKMGVDEEAGENVDARRKFLQDAVVAEIDKYGHPKNNKKLAGLDSNSRAFGVFRNSVDTKGNFSDLLAGTLDKSAAKGYREDSVYDIVSYIYNSLDEGNIELEDVKELYKGPMKLESLADLAGIDGVSITPDGRLLPSVQYCSGNVVAKMAECTDAIANTDDERLKTQFRKQIDEMNAKIARVPVEDITFNMQAKWLDKKYLIEYLRQNGYPDATYGEYREYQEEQYDGSLETVKGFVEDFNAVNGQLYLMRKPAKWHQQGELIEKPEGFNGQLQKYLNGGNITSNKQEQIEEYKERARRLESQFDAFCKQHIDVDELTEKYNMTFNGYVQPEYSTAKLDIDDIISGDIKPHTYQCQEVRRLSEQGSGICGFGTGLGKSFTALAMAGYNYKHGKAKRTCVVVPSAVLENWYHEANMFYNKQYMKNNVLFVGLEPKRDKDGNIVTKPLLDEKGQPRKREDGTALTQDVMRFANDKESIYEAMWKIPQSNYSLVVMTKEKFQTIPIKPSTMKDYTTEMVDRHLMSDKEAEKAAGNNSEKGGTSYQDDVHRNELEGRFSDERTQKKGELPFLEDMGFDSIITDESHFFKNSLSGGKATQGIAYVPNPATSAIATDMAIKCSYMRKKMGGRGVYGLTATPVTNSPIEIFNMLSLVAPKEDFENMGVYTVDDFVRLFGKIEQRLRSSVSGDPKIVDTLVGFQNLSGLRNLFKKYVNIKTVEDVDDEIHVPNSNEAEEIVPMTEEQTKLYNMLRSRAKEIGKPGNKDSIFSVMRDMDRCTTDVDLFWHRMTFVFDRKHLEAIEAIIPHLPTKFEYEEKDETTGEKVKYRGDFPPKLETSGDTVTLIVHEQHEAEALSQISGAGIGEEEIAHPVSPKYAKLIDNLKKHLDAGGKQIVFTEEKTQHKKIKRILVHNLPIEAKQVEIINAEDAAGAKLDKISKAYNAGDVKIVIANKKAEVGVNLQKGTTAIHHLTLPWTPASINQRNGRGVRQGNKVETVDVFYYEGQDTFDGYRKQLLMGKGNWINQLLMGKESNVENADVSADEEMLATITGQLDEYRKRKAEEEERRKNAAKQQLVNDLRRLASVQQALDSWETRKQAAKEKADKDLADQQRKLDNAIYNKKDEEAIQRIKDGLAKIEERKARIDAKFDEEKRKMEATKAQVKGVLKQAAKEGKLPYDESLVENPGNCLISMNGQLFTVGSYWELIHDTKGIGSEGDIFRIKEIFPESNEIRVALAIEEDNWRRENVLNANRVSFRPCTISTDELDLRRLVSGTIRYTEYPKSGISKALFDAHADEIETSEREHCIARTKADGKIVIVDEDNIRFNKETMTLVYPDVNDQDFRKSVAQALMQHRRDYSDLYWANELVEELLGKNYEEELKQFYNNATDTQINEIVATAYQQFAAMYDSEDYPEELDKLNGLMNSRFFGVSAKVREAMQAAKYDNVNDALDRLVSYIDGKRVEIAKRIEAIEEEKKRKADEAVRSHPNFREVSEEWVKKFSDLGLTIKYNTQDVTVQCKKKVREFKAFERLFLFDKMGLSGVLRKTGKMLAARFGADYTNGGWVEQPGFWWHIDGNADLKELYDIVS